MAKGFESAETEGLQRAPSTKVCEAYACVDVARNIVNGIAYCEAHTPRQGARAAPEAAGES